MTDDEIVDLIINLLALYVPDSMDKRLAVGRLLEKNLWLPIKPYKCPKCKQELFCVNCDDIDISHETTVRIGNHTITHN